MIKRGTPILGDPMGGVHTPLVRETGFWTNHMAQQMQSSTRRKYLTGHRHCDSTTGKDLASLSKPAIWKNPPPKH